ncbi:MAG: ABC transporter substrate-binding protein [Clostridia bacterium]|nr:ABC transporter substrate-binding protein [Clostridia bacterium]
MFAKSRLTSTVFTVILALLSVIAVGCGPTGTDKTSSGAGGPTGEQKPESVKIGVLTGLTGKGADWGKKQKVALEIAEKEINQGGGINGNPVKFIICDTGGENQQAVILTRKLATEDKVLAILGPYFSGEAEVAFPQANELKLPIISATSAKPGISAANRPWAFRNSMTDDKMLKVALPLFLKKYPVKNIAVVTDMKDAISKSFGTKTLPAALKATPGLVMLKEGQPVTYNTGDTDFSAQVSALKQLKPEAIGVGGLYQEIASLAREMKRQGMNIPALGNVGMYSEALIEQGGDAVEGWVALSNFWPTSPDPKVQEFNAKFKTAAQAAGLGPTPDTFAVSMYDTALITAELIRKNKLTAQSPLEEARAAIRDGWAGVKDYPGVMGKTSIDGAGDGIKEVYTLIVKDGKWERLE